MLERENARIEARAQELADESESKARLALDLLAFDFSPEGERLRRYQATCTRFVTRVIDSFCKPRRGKDGADRVDSRPWTARTGLPLWHEPPSASIDPFDPLDSFDPIDPFSSIHGNGAMPPQDTAMAPADKHVPADELNLQNEATAAGEPAPGALAEAVDAPAPQVEAAACDESSDQPEDTTFGELDHEPAVSPAIGRILQNEATPAIFSGPHRQDLTERNAGGAGRRSRKGRSRRRETANRELSQMIDPVALPRRSPISLASVSLRPRLR